MADHRVTVTFTPPTQSSWSFDPKTIPVKNNSTITLEAAKNSTWTFTGTVLGIPSSWSTATHAAGKKLVITDPDTPPPANYSFQVVVIETGTNNTYTSPLIGPINDTGVPPVIQNDGSGLPADEP